MSIKALNKKLLSHKTIITDNVFFYHLTLEKLWRLWQQIKSVSILHIFCESYYTTLHMLTLRSALATKFSTIIMHYCLQCVREFNC